MIRGWHFIAFALVFALACSSKKDSASTSTTTPPAGAPVCDEGTPGCIGWVSCPPDITEKDDSVGTSSSCREILPTDECAAGTMPVLGSHDCVPVGPQTCENGFAKDPSGWGCQAIVPPTACTDATRDALGETTCTPVGDCNAAFPPANTTLNVSAAFTDADVGPTKFKTLLAALAAAKSNDIIAVDSGTYNEGIEPAVANITVIGRCADKVHFVGTGLEVHGVLANGAGKSVTVKGVTLTDHYEGVRAQGGASVTLEDVVIDAPRFTGLISYQPPSLIHAERVVIRNVKPHAGQTTPVVSVNPDEGGAIELVDVAIANSNQAGVLVTNATTPKFPSKVTIAHSVIRDTNITANNPDGAAVVISGVSTGTITDSAILNTRRVGAMLLYDGASLTMTRGEIRGTVQDTTGSISAGIFANTGTVSLEDLSIHDTVQSGIAISAKASLTAKGLVVQGTKPGSDGIFGIGANADTGGSITIDNAAFVDNAYYGVNALDVNTKVTLSNTLIRGTAGQKVEGGGLGRGLNVEDGALAALDTVSIFDNDGEGILVRNETADGHRAHVTAKRLVISGGRTFYGTGVFVAKGALFEADGGAILSSIRAGIIVNETLGGKGSISEATLTHVVIRDTKPNTDVQSTNPNDTTVDGFGIGNVGNITLHSCAVLDNVQFGMLVGGATDHVSTTTIGSSFIGNTKTNDDGSFGHGIVGFTNGNVIIDDTEIASNNIGLVFDNASATVTSSRVRGNSVGIQVQHASTLTAGATAPDSPDPDTVFVSDDSQFVENATRVGSGEVPLPADPLASISDPKQADPKPAK